MWKNFEELKLDCKLFIKEEKGTHEVLLTTRNQSEHSWNSNHKVQNRPLIELWCLSYYHNVTDRVLAQSDPCASGLAGGLSEGEKKLSMTEHESDCIMLFSSDQRSPTHLFVPILVLFCCIYPRYLKGRSVQILSAINRSMVQKNAGDCWSSAWKVWILAAPVCRPKYTLSMLKPRMSTWLFLL